MDKNPKFIIIVGIIITLLVIGGAGFWYFGGKIPFAGKEEQSAVETLICNT